MDSNSKVYVAGNTGLVGSAIVRMLHRKGYTNILSTPSSHFDLRRQDDVGRFFQINEPEYVYLAAAKVVVLVLIEIIQHTLSTIT